MVALLMACAFIPGQPGMGYEDQDQETITFDCNQPFCYEGFLEYVEEDDEPEEGQRALHLVAAGGGPLALLFLLLVAGARVDAKDDDGNGPEAGVREQARGSGGRADGGDQARGRPGPAG